MDTARLEPSTIDEYIDAFPADVQDRLQIVRQIIKDEVPEAEEAIKYGMPGFVFRGNFLHFAAFKRHIGLYGASAAFEVFEELAPYRAAKSTIQFSVDQPLPVPLIRKLVKFCADQRRARPDKRPR